MARRVCKKSHLQILVTDFVHALVVEHPLLDPLPDLAHLGNLLVLEPGDELVPQLHLVALGVGQQRASGLA